MSVLDRIIAILIVVGICAITRIINGINSYRDSPDHHMRSIGYIKGVDEINRVHIPKEICEKLGGLDYVKVYCKNNRIVIKKIDRAKALKEKAQREVEA